MRSKLTVISIFFLLILVVSVVHAEDATVTTTTAPTGTATQRTPIRELKMNRTLLQDRLTEARKTAQGTFAAQREAFKQKLATIKDEKRKVLVDRVDNKLSNVNQNRTDHMSSVLDRLSAVLDKLNTRIQAAKTAGKDTAAAEAAYKTAKDAVTTAENAVAAQAAREYVANITDETTLKTTVGSVVSQLEADLQATHKTVADAKQAVLKAAEAVFRIGTLENSPTSIPVSSPTPAI